MRKCYVILKRDRECVYEPGIVSRAGFGMNGRVVAINISRDKGVRKETVGEVLVKEAFGIEGDAHASPRWHRQVSLLAMESIQKMRDLGLDVNPGDFAENITTEGIDLRNLPVSTRIGVGATVELEVTQIGKTCHDRCAIYYQAGCCVMPEEGVFARVIRGGKMRVGDSILIDGRSTIDEKPGSPDVKGGNTYTQ